MRKLIVEGYSDQNFLLGLQRVLNANKDGALTGFDVVYPSSIRIRPGKPGALKHFELLLTEAAEPKRVETVALLIDADFPPQDGVHSSQELITSLMAKCGFRLVDAGRRIYKHLRSGTIASYFITPDNAGDGHIESLMLASLNADQQRYIGEVVRPFIHTLATPRFAAANVDRAEFYTFLAIQRKPDKSAPTILDEGLVDLDGHGLRPLIGWLRDVFGGNA